MLIVDNPVVSTLAEAGVLTTTDENKLDTTPIAPNLLAAGQLDGKTYGVPIGANTLALYYNKKVLKAAGVDVASVKDWAVADRGAGQGQGGRQEGHHLLGDRHRGGQLPVPALVLGLGRATSPKLDSPQARRGAALWTDWLRRATRPTRSSTTPRPPAGRSSPPATTPSRENGTWQLAQRQEGRLRLRHHPDPGQGRRHRAGADRRRVRHRPGAEGHRAATPPRRSS